MKKKGMSHVEAVISFVIFMSVLSVIFIFLQPIREPKLDSVVLDIVEQGFIRENSITLGSIFFRTDRVGTTFGSSECMSFSHPLDISSNGLRTSNVFITDSKGVIQNMKFVNGDSEISINDQLTNTFILYFTFDEEFINVDSSCTLNDITDSAEFSAPKTEEVLSFIKLNNFIDDYENSYFELKERLNIPTRNDFAITISRDINRTKLERDIPPRKEVFARELSFLILDNKEIKNIDVLIRIW